MLLDKAKAMTVRHQTAHVMKPNENDPHQPRSTKNNSQDGWPTGESAEKLGEKVVEVNL